MYRYVLIIFLGMLASGCHPDPTQKYIPASRYRREKLATPEPGTYLKPGAYRILKQINKAMEEPERYERSAEWVIKRLSVHQKRILDTVICSQDTLVPVRVYYPDPKSLAGLQPAALYVHGGGFVMGSIEQYHMLVSKLARESGRVIVSVGYRLAPDSPFPAAINDAFSVLKWLMNYGASIGIDPVRIAVMGDSAGGNIATVLTLLCRDHHLPQPECQVLIYPAVTFVERSFPSREYFGKSREMDYVLNESFLRMVKREYMGTETNDSLPYLSPLEADLTGDLAPALVITAECDPLRDGGRLYASELAGAGVEVRQIEYSGMIHGFLSFHLVLREAMEAIKQIGDYLGNH